MRRKLGAWLRRRALDVLPVSRRRCADLDSRLEALEARLAALPGPRPPAGPRPTGRPSVAEQRAEVGRLLTEGLTQAAIARRLGVTRQWVNQLVRSGL